MLLSELSPGGADLEIAALAYDSRAVVPGSLFFCVPGLRVDGHDLAPEAIAAGAGALVVERPLGLGVPELLVESTREAMAPLAVRFNGDPSATLRVVGVTGTNGKTTSAFLVAALLEAAGESCGLLGTVKSVIGGREQPVIHTTPEAIDLQASFRAMLDGGDRACAMEVSSHALALHRVDGTRFAAALFTNLTQDHLDFHHTMEDYFEAKRRLFAPPPPVSVVNVDDPYGRRLAAEIADAITFGLQPGADYGASALSFGVAGASFVASTPEGELELRTLLPGSFNVLNVLGALATAHALGVPLELIASALPAITPAPGRFQALDEGQPFTVLVDYAHTPDSLENVLRAARSLGEGRLVSVFGCGGDRDRGKRPQMGAISTELADLTIVTSDNPRSEEPEMIVGDILTGTSGSSAVEAIVERADAIERAIALAADGDVVVIAGKGHEQGQEFADGRKIPFDDAQVARAALRARR
ncbi:MAG TPA: UDP-N-acetylmuramoyl-L-alanyl-D-glutamate--2,6-diaminopimelate ligase [Solirubrobacteraceae bacterium]|jgi:UDP-N-acetylmuramoyl-L-alanyl-D-glutamate--2,6-diaminopimelate ligase